MPEFKSGFVSIVGKPNAGKSTLMNLLVGEQLSIVTPKAQTTRHRIMGMINTAHMQIVYSDTPGMLEPKYALHEAMMNYVKVSLEDADLVLLVIAWDDALEDYLVDRLQKVKCPVVLVLNKIDLAPNQQAIDQKLEFWKSKINTITDSVAVSASKKKNIDSILPVVQQKLPVHPPYFPQDDLTDRSERFFAAEIIREKIFFNYEQEIPYSAQVVIESFKESDDIIRIRAEIYVERDSQKGIIIGKAGSSLKKVGIEARKDMEAFFRKKIHLETHVKVADNWRKERFKLKQFGYLE
jgi:GTP-binding protein Era